MRCGGGGATRNRCGRCLAAGGLESAGVAAAGAAAAGVAAAGAAAALPCLCRCCCFFPPLVGLAIILTCCFRRLLPPLAAAFALASIGDGSAGSRFQAWPPGEGAAGKTAGAAAGALAAACEARRGLSVEGRCAAPRRATCRDERRAARAARSVPWSRRVPWLIDCKDSVRVWRGASATTRLLWPAGRAPRRVPATAGARRAENAGGGAVTDAAHC